MRERIMCRILALIAAIMGFGSVFAEVGYKDKDPNNYAELPTAPVVSGDRIDVTAANAQYVLDGAYGSIDGKTINFTESIETALIFGRPTKYAGSNTKYHIGSFDSEEMPYTEFREKKLGPTWTASCYYTRTLQNVTFTANEGVTLAGLKAHGGDHVYGSAASPVYDYVLDTGNWCNQSCYYTALTLQNITFRGVSFTKQVNMDTSSALTLYDGVTFKDCHFTTGGTTADDKAAIRFGDVDAGTSITIIGNTATFNNVADSTKEPEEFVKAQSIAEGVTTTITGNDWNNYLPAATENGNDKLAETTIYFAKVGDKEYTSLADALNAAAGKGSVCELLCDVTLAGEWTPIPSFSGTFDGKGFTIRGLKVTSGSSVGLIGVLDGGEVTNVKFADVEIETTGDDVGAAVGSVINGGTVSDIEVISGSLTGNKRVGGVVGKVKASGTVENCSNAAAVEARKYNAGGIVGAAYYTEVGKEMYIRGCTNTGAIASASNCAGGIVGLSAANVLDNSNSGTVTGTATSVGGVVGEQKTYGKVCGNTNSGAVTNNGGGHGTGGIVGWLRYHGSGEDAAYGQSAVIEVSGNVNSAVVNGGNDAGGIIGTVYNSAVVSGNNNTAENLSGKTFAAGIVGNYQTTENPSSAAAAENKLTFTGNASTTALADISGQNKDLLIYTNGNPIIESTYVAQIGETKYETFEAALEAANAAGDVSVTVTLLADVAYAENGKGLWNVTHSMTIDGNGHTMSGWGSRGGNKTTLAINNGGMSPVDVKLIDLTINNAGDMGRPIETRGNIGSLTIENCTINATGNGNNQGITIGGSQASKAVVALKDTTVSAGMAGYPYISFNPAEVTIQGGALSGYCGMYFKGENGSFGSRGTSVTATGTMFDCPNVHSGEPNDFGVFVLQDDGISVELVDCRINAEAKGGAQQAVLVLHSLASRQSEDCRLAISGDDTEVNGTLMLDAWDNSSEDVVLAVSGGTFTEKVDEAYCAPGYVPTVAQDENGYYGVKVGAYVAQIGDKKYETLQEALDAVAEGETVKLLRDVTQATGVGFSKALAATFDLDGHTFKVTDDATHNHRAIKVTKGTLTILNGTIDARNVDTNGEPADYNDKTTYTQGIYGTLRAEDGGKLVLKDLTLFNNHLWGMSVKVGAGSEATLDGVTVNSRVGGGLEAAGGTVTIRNSTFTQAGLSNYSPYLSTGIAVSTQGTVDIEDTVTVKGVYALYVYSSGGCINVDGGSFSVVDGKECIHVDGAQSAPSTVNITDGLFNGAIAEGGTIENITISISGGVYSVEPKESYTAEGYVVQANAAANKDVYPWTVGLKAPESTIVVHGQGQVVSDDAKAAFAEVADKSPTYEVVKQNTDDKVTASEVDDRNLDFATLATGTYTLRAKVVENGETKTVDIIDVGVVQVAARKTTILAVPFNGVDGKPVTAATLFDAAAAGLADGDTLNVYDAKAKKYVNFAYDNGAWISADNGGADPAAYTLAPGSAAVLNAAAPGTVALVGTPVAEVAVAPVAAGTVGLGGNVATADRKVSEIAVDGGAVTAKINVFAPSADGNVQYVLKGGAWYKEARETLPNGATVVKAVPVEDSDVVPAGTGYWVVNQAGSDVSVK
ncbi:MAG: hypothetical protein ACI4RA_05150 [Kiritimatiellia bacterium]